MAKAAYNYTKSNQLCFVCHFNYTSPVSITDALYGSPNRKAYVRSLTANLLNKYGDNYN